MMVKDLLCVAGSLMITTLVILTVSITGCKTSVSMSEEQMDHEVKYTDEEKILILAQTAASSHNSQPWRVKKDENGSYFVMAEEERWLNYVDPDKREYLLSLGAYLENLRIAAECFGYHADIQILMSDADDADVARFTLVRQGGNRNDERIILMRTSSMAKTKYRKTIEPESPFLMLLEEQNHALWIDRSDPVYDYILEATVEANSVQAWNDQKQRELADYICFTQEDEDYGVGMTPAMLDLPWFMSRSWYKKAGRETVMSRMFRNGTAAKAKKLMKNSAGLILMTSPDYSVQSLLECGGQFQRLYWECKEVGIELHTVSQILEESPMREMLTDKISVNGPVQFVLRAGRTGSRYKSADAVSSASIRMSPAGFFSEQGR